MEKMLRERARERVGREATLRYDIRAARRADLAQLEWFGAHRDLRLVEAAGWTHVEAGDVLFLVADVRGFPVAQLKIALVHEEDVKADGARSGYLYGLRVFGPFQRLGIGSALIARAEEILRERGYRHATIAVERDNPDARRLYERLGYASIREVPRAWSYVDPDGRTRKVDVIEVLLRKAL
jgi:ribosomal protein S18 acetylase RimI-like enzyme